MQEVMLETAKTTSLVFIILLGAMVMAGYRQTSGSKSSYYPALIILIGLVLIGYAISQYDMNIKLINSFEDKVGIFLGLLGSGLVVISLIWSGGKGSSIKKIQCKKSCLKLQKLPL